MKVMEAHYIIDSGNTNLKVAKFSPEGELLETRILNSLEEFTLPDNAKALFCSVNLSLEERYKDKILDFNSLKAKLDLETHYANTIGNDRLALVYGLIRMNPNKSFVAVDAGSFITIDIVQDGIHRGGFIYPGINTFLKTFDQNGKNLPYLNTENISNLAIATTTEEAIKFSAGRYLDSIKNHILSYSTDEIFITGGEAELLDIAKAKKEKDLLLKALHIILKENLN
jgi:type III pantothenate kinase